MYKRSNVKYGKLPAKLAEEIPRNKLFVYLIDPIEHLKTYVSVNREIHKFNP